MMRNFSKVALVSVGVLLAAKVGTIAANAAGEEDAEQVAPAAEQVVESPAKDVLPEMLAMLAAERDVLEKKRVALETKEADLALVEETLSRQMTDLSALKEELRTLLEASDAGKEQDLKKLVGIYTAMKPTEAGSIMGDMDLEVATLVIAAMKESDSGPILAKMDVRRAQTISRIIYERSRLPGDQRPVPVPAGG